MHTTRILAGALVLAAVATAGLQAQASVSTDARATTVDTTERAYVEILTKAHNDEIAASRSIAGVTQNADVRNFAQKLVDDHTKALAKLQPVATRLGVSSMASADASTPEGMRPAGTMDSMGTTRASANTTSLPAPTAGMGAGAMGDSASRSSSNSPVSDKQYIDAMVTGHQQLLGKLPMDGRGIKDKELRSVVSDTRKSVQRHYDAARAIQTKMGGREK